MTFSQEELRSSMKLYAVTDNAWLGDRTLAVCVQQAVDGGATFVQLRHKGATTDQLVQEAEPLLAACRRAGVPFVIDDDVQAAQLSGADGVHVGQSDAACVEARAVLGPDAIVGVSAQTVEQALAAQNAGASYLGVGAVIATPTKPDAELVSYETLQEICRAVDIPVVAIGGLNESTLDFLEGSGVDGAAVVSAIFAAENIEEATRKMACRMDSILAGPARDD